MADNQQSQSGFALLVSLIVVSVVVSVSLVLLDVTIKQLRLSSIATDSEIAFHAANAGVECSQYLRRELADTIEGDQFSLPVAPPGGHIDSSLECFGVTESDYNRSTVSNSGDGDATLYEYQFSWAGGTRCTEIDMLTVVTDVLGTDDVQIDNAYITTDVLPGYPVGQDLICQTGSLCTVISSKGFNKSCGQKTSFGTVQREVLLEL